MGSSQSVERLEAELKLVNDEIQRLKGYDAKSQGNYQNSIKLAKQNLEAQKNRLDEKFDNQFFESLLDEYGKKEFEIYVKKHLDLEKKYEKELKKFHDERKLEKSLIYKDIKKAKGKRTEIWKEMIRIEWRRMEFVGKFHDNDNRFVNDVEVTV